MTTIRYCEWRKVDPIDDASPEIKAEFELINSHWKDDTETMIQLAKLLIVAREQQVTNDRINDTISEARAIWQAEPSIWDTNDKTF